MVTRLTDQQLIQTLDLAVELAPNEGARRGFMAAYSAMLLDGVSNLDLTAALLSALHDGLRLDNWPDTVERAEAVADAKAVAIG